MYSMSLQDKSLKISLGGNSYKYVIFVNKDWKKCWPQPNVLATGGSVVATAGMAGKSHVIGVSV